MIKNYFKIALRSFWKHKLFTLINIIGLSIGISASVVIYLIVNYDFSFDKFHRDSDRIYRIVSNGSYQGQKNYNRGVPGPVAPAVQAKVSGVEFTAPVFSIGPNVFIENKKGAPTKFKDQERIALTGPDYFKIFDYTWVAGSPSTALNAPNQAVLTTDRAKMYFPSLSYSQIIGQVVTYDTLKTTVTGIVKPFTELTDLTFHDFISFSSANPNNALGHETGLTQWGNTTSSSSVFIKLAPKTTVGNFEKQINAILDKESPMSAEDKKNGATQAFALQPLSDLHFNQNYGTFDFSDGANAKTLYGLLVIALFLLVLACINFINLTTAQATQRAKEIGIRKTMGSRRSQLILQFLSETFLVTLFAVIVSIILAPLILKIFADFVNPGVKADILQQPAILLFLLCLTIGVSLLAGFYPAILMSGYKPIEVLKSGVKRLGSNTRSAWLRKTLTVSQFVIAQFFIIGTFMVGKQIYYVLHKDLGFKKEAIVFIRTPYRGRSEERNRLLLNKLSSIPYVELASIGAASPMSGNASITGGTYSSGKKEMQINIELKAGDENYLKVYQIKLLAGRNLTSTDTLKNFVINNTLAKTMGFTRPQDAIGKQITKFNGEHIMTIVGVIGDFPERSLHSPITPLALEYAKGNYNNSEIHIALKPETAGGKEWNAAITAMGKVWKEFFPEDNFDYQFYDQSIGQFYTREQHISTLLTWAMILSIVISCLGLLGLAIYTTTQRTKEIGVRKVLGATVTQIVAMLSTELVALIGLAFVIVTPIAWYSVNNWMESFADRTPISWWVFAAGGIIMLIAALMTSCIQTIKAALTNPVKSLRSE